MLDVLESVKKLLREKTVEQLMEETTQMLREMKERDKVRANKEIPRGKHAKRKKLAPKRRN